MFGRPVQTGCVSGLAAAKMTSPAGSLVVMTERYGIEVGAQRYLPWHTLVSHVCIESLAIQLQHPCLFIGRSQGRVKSLLLGTSTYLLQLALMASIGCVPPTLHGNLAHMIDLALLKAEDLERINLYRQS